MSVVALQQLLVLTVCCLLMHTHAWTPDPIALDKTAYCKVCTRLADDLDEIVAQTYRLVEPPQRPRVSDVKLLLRNTCKRAKFHRKGLEACNHIVRRSMSLMVHTVLDLYFSASDSLERNPRIQAGTERLLSKHVCTSLAYTECPPRTLDTFITPDSELWHVPDEVQAAQQAARNAAAAAAAEQLHEAAADAPPTQPSPRPEARWAHGDEYFTATHEEVDFDDDDQSVLHSEL